MSRTTMIVGALLFASFASAAQVKGPASVVDGDTLWIAGVKVRLNGIDAPERGEPLSREATRTLETLVAARTVTCHLNGERSYDRIIGTCYVTGNDLAAAVIAGGHALDCARYSGGRYRGLETRDARQRMVQAAYC